MKPRPLWQVTVTIPREAEDAVFALLERVFGAPPALYTNAETRVTTATVYLSKPLSQAVRREIAAGLERIASFSLDVGGAAIRSSRVRREDWSESWKKYFKTIEIGRALLIKPSWSRRQARSGQAVLVLDPGLSFGTGQHPTTSFCLCQLVAVRKRGERQSMLDMGTGSGILALAAAKLGFTPVRAFDFDPVAVRVAQANARRNRVAERVSIRRADLTKLARASRERFDVICANLTDDLLVSELDKILNRLAPEGRLVLAGILAAQFAGVRAACERRGLKLAATQVEREWQSGAFVR